MEIDLFLYEPNVLLPGVQIFHDIELKFLHGVSIIFSNVKNLLLVLTNFQSQIIEVSLVLFSVSLLELVILFQGFQLLL